MPNVLNEFAGDGVTQTFNFSMTGGYLSRDYVYFFTRPNDDLLNYTPYNDDDVTWITDFSVRTASPIPVGTTFVILRSTTLNPLVDFQNTSRITEKNLDTATWQSIHIAAETADTVGRIQLVATDAKRESADALLNSQTATNDASAAVLAATTAVGTANNAVAVANEAKSIIDDAVSGAVVSFNGRVGNVTPEVGDYTKAMVGLGDVDNVRAADLRDRTTHTGTQPISTVVGLQGALDSKVDKVSGKQLSTEDFTSAEKSQLSGLQYALDNKADTSSVAQAIAMAATFTTVPATFQAWSIVVTQPHLRSMIWSSAQSKYVRAPWHPVGQVVYSYGATLSGSLPIRADLSYNQADYPDLAAYLGLSGTGTFSLIEARGEFIRVLDNGRGKDVNRVIRSTQADAIRDHTHHFNYNGIDSTNGYAGIRLTGNIEGTGANTLGMSGGGGSETRPSNIALPLWVTY